MKKLSFLTCLSAALFSSMTMADFNLTDCYSVRGTGSEMTLVISEEEVVQVRFNLRELLTSKISEGSDTTTYYQVLGLSNQIMEVDNSILLGSSGYVRLSNDEFRCY